MIYYNNFITNERHFSGIKKFIMSQLKLDANDKALIASILEYFGHLKMDDTSTEIIGMRNVIFSLFCFFNFYFFTNFYVLLVFDFYC